MKGWAKLGCLAGVAAILAGSLRGLAGAEPPAHQVPAMAEAEVWPGTAHRPAFPLRVRPGARFLEDASGVPFLVHADVPGNILVQLKREDAIRYLDDRQKRGFNTLFTGLIEKFYASHPPANAYGDAPFRVAGDFTTPVEAYFAHVDWFLEEAARRGFLVGLTPAWLGFKAGKEGWYREMVASGPERLREYGRYLGKRYARFDNVLWIHGGDYNPPDKALVRAIAEGIREFDRRALHTAHAAPGFAAIDVWRGETWLQIDTVYTYGPVYPPTLQQYRDRQRLPFILMESAFENEHGADERRLRAQAYQALLTGAAGHVFGNNPIWHFDAPGIYDAPMTWQDALASRGAQSITHLRNLFATLDWTRLVPDVDGRFLRAGHGEGPERAVAAVASDDSFGLIYLPSARAVTLDSGRLGNRRTAWKWYDPSGGTFRAAEEGARDGPLVTMMPPGQNAAGYEDWLLIATAGD